MVVLFDFDGVLCRDRFYESTLLNGHTEVYEWLQKNVFANRELVQSWMRGVISSTAINKLIANNTYIDFETIQTLYERSVSLMSLDARVLTIAERLRASGHTVGIVTDNMDVFTEIITVEHKLDSAFDLIINSADYGLLKQDGGVLYDIALGRLNASYQDSIMIDNARSNINTFTSSGGAGLVYTDVSSLETFLRKQNLIQQCAV